MRGRHAGRSAVDIYVQRTAAAAAADSLANGYMTPLREGAPEALLYYTINQVFVLSTFRGKWKRSDGSAVVPTVPPPPPPPHQALRYWRAHCVVW
jgi:hypothetical protein